MDILILRLIHIGAGVFWVGAVFTTVLFLQPTAIALGPAAAPFQAHLVRSRRYALATLIAAATTVVAGAWLLWITTDGLNLDIALDASRLGFTVGGVVAILTFAFGSTYVYPRTVRIARIIAGAMSEGRPPSPEEQAQLGTMRGELLTAGWVVVGGLVIAVAAMATARYWSLVL